MPHTLIIGMTESGKTSLAKKLAQEYKSKGIEVLVLDPLGDPGWEVEKVYDDPEEYLEEVFKKRHCALFIDESGEMIGRYSGVMGKLATRSRHYGHNAHFIVQRCAQLDKTVRDQCSYIYLFRVSKKDSETLSDEYCQEALKSSATLDKLEFIMLARFKNPRRMKLKFESKPQPKVTES